MNYLHVVQDFVRTSGVSAEKLPVERVCSGCLSALFALFKPVGVVAGFEDVAVVGDAVE
jgi:hypothetical protein